MTRKNKLLANTGVALLYQIVALVCGFILPRLILSAYGSKVNGLVTSITHYLSLIALCECGVGAVIQANLYRPLEEKDTAQLSRIVASSDRFFKRIAYILFAYVAILCVVYPVIVLDDFDFLFTAILIVVISISSFAQYYLGMTNRLLLTADQYGFVYTGILIICLILNTVFSVVLINWGLSIHFIKLTTSLIFLCQPLLLMLIVRKKYTIDRKTLLTEEPIKQKWNGLMQHLAFVVQQNTGTITLTLFSTLENVSIYNVYLLVTNGIKQMVVALTSGTQAMLGNMLVKNEKDALSSAFGLFEWCMHTLTTLAFTITGLLILPFVRVYTLGITDTNYYVPVFAVLLTISTALICLQIPYKTLVLAAGHFKETQLSSLIEAGINIVASVALVFTFDLSGVAVGTILAISYRLIYLVVYLKKNLIQRKLRCFVKHIVVDVVSILLMVLTVQLFDSFFILTSVSYWDWILLALKVGITCVLEAVVINFLVYPKLICGFVKRKC